MDTNTMAQRLPPPQSPLFFIRKFGNGCEYELAENGNEREAGAYGKEISEAGAYGNEKFPAHPLQFERTTGDKAGSKKVIGVISTPSSNMKG